MSERSCRNCEYHDSIMWYNGDEYLCFKDGDNKKVVPKEMICEDWRREEY